ncbi:MAG: HEAT repeat domain-containing protein, partial [Brevefilum sp.]
AASILSPLLSDPSNRLRRNLIEMMMQADYEAALPLVRPLLRDNAITVRETALAAVSKWEDRVSEEDVRQIAYSDPNPFVRPQAVITLTNLLGQDALPDLIYLSDDLNLHVRRAVAQSLAEIDHLTPEGKRALIKLASEEDTAEFIYPVLEKHDLSAVHPIPIPEDKLKGPVPDRLRDDKGALLDLLETWQKALPELQNNFELEELSDVDHALSTLIVTLRETDNGSK